MIITCERSGLQSIAYKCMKGIKNTYVPTLLLCLLRDLTASHKKRIEIFVNSKWAPGNYDCMNINASEAGVINQSMQK